MQALFSPGAAIGPWDMSGNGLFSVQWAEGIEAATNGRLEVELLPPGSLFPNADALDAVGQGIVDAMPNMYGAYIGGKLPEGTIGAGIPFNALSIMDVWTLVYDYGLYDIIREAYAEHNIEYLALYPSQPRRINANFDMPDPESFNGKKIRAAGYDGEVALMLGASPVNIPVMEVYMAMKLGTVDACFGNIAVLEFIKWKEVSTDILLSPFAHIMNSGIANMDSMNALPDDLRETVIRETRHIMLASTIIQTSQEDYMLARVMEEYGIVPWTWSDEDMARIRTQAVDTIWPKLAALRLIGLPSPRLCGFSLWRGWLRLPTRRKFASLYRALRQAIGLRRRGRVRCGADRVQAASPIPRAEPSAKPSPPLAAMKQFATD